MKAQKLARSLTRGVIDRDLKPDTEERRRIAAILRQPPNRPLTVEQKGLLWRFRFSLTSDRRALTRFLKSVDWADAQEAKQVWIAAAVFVQLVICALPIANCHLSRLQSLCRNGFP